MRALFGAAVLGLGAILSLLAGCEGTTTGQPIANVALQPGEGNSYAPVKLNVTTDMNPIAVNFRADFSDNFNDFGKFNVYRVALSHGGNVVESRSFNVNHPQTRPLSGDNSDRPPPSAGYVRTVFTTDVQASGEYEITITAVQRDITISNASVEVRRNVARGVQ